ncbi:MAG: SRPBCC family protein [Pseudolabrys sp.]|jgi:uncharacterized protein YndB with AHSA1/START domain
MNSLPIKTDPKFDLVLERDIDVPVELVWKAWTTPEHVKHWFVPKPWTIVSCEIDLRPGGVFSSVMRSPEGQEFPNIGCYLEVVPNKRLVFTDTLLPGYRPAPNPFFTAYLLLDGNGSRTRYTAIALHGTEEARDKHEKMGFHDGWGTVVTQMVAFIKAGFKPAT